MKRIFALRSSPMPVFGLDHRPLVQAIGVAVVFFAIAGSVEALLIRIIQPTEMELDWISDVVLSVALGAAVYLWLHLRATRLALTERERSQLVIDTQLSLAAAMQRRLLPPTPPPQCGLEWAATLAPAGQIGGDFYDFIDPNPSTRLVLIADVSGKGISAAMALTLLRSTFRNIARDANSPAQIAGLMSRSLYDEWNGTPYVTCVIARIDLEQRVLTYTNAGHPSGLVFRDHGYRHLSAGGPPLGLLRDAQYLEERVELRDGDVCILVTDGVTESFDDARPVGSIAEEVVRAHKPSAARICSAIMSRALEGPGPRDVEDWTDDRTMIVIVCRSTQRRTCSDEGSCDASQPPPSAWINDTLATSRLV
jgi:hypothetical protein